MENKLKTWYIIYPTGVIKLIRPVNKKYIIPKGKIEVSVKDGNMIIVHHYKSELVRDITYRKRILLIESATNSDGINLALYCVEYMGKFPSNTRSHGNSKYFLTEYTITDPKALA